MLKFLRGAVVLGAVAAAAFLWTGTAHAVPFNKTYNGNATYYDNSGVGACGTSVYPQTQDLVAISPVWWTTANPNNDPVCSGVSVRVTYNGKSITIPVRDKCAGCSRYHIDLSEKSFKRLAPLSVGNITVTWKFVRS